MVCLRTPRLSRRMIAAILGVGLTISALDTALHLILTRTSETARLEDAAMQMSVTDAPAFAEALWLNNDRLLRLLADGLLARPEISAVRVVRIRDGTAPRVLVDLGRDGAVDATPVAATHSLPLRRVDEAGVVQDLATLDVTVDSAQVTRRLTEAIPFLLLLQMAKVTLAVGALSILFHRAIGRRLAVLGERIKALGPPDTPMRPDELSDVETAFETLATALHATNVTLERELEQRRTVEAELRGLTASLETRVRERTAALERSNADLENFASIASHDLQEPLRTVSGFLGLLERRYGDALPAEGHEFLTLAREGAHRMSRLITDLLSYSRVTTRGEPFQPVSLAQAASHAVTGLTRAIEDSGGTVVTDGDLPNIQADEAQMTRLLGNLIGNALKYRHPDRFPRIHLSASDGATAQPAYGAPVDLEDLDPARWVTVHVADNGRGIPETLHTDIFKVFRRGEADAGIEGTGIGLAVCKRIAERHGGWIGLTSSPGVGSTFHVVLPVNGPEVPAT